MKFILLGIIRFYWIIKPKAGNPKCIFRKSCSCYVYDIISDKGILKGLAAFYFRYKNCRYGYEIFKSPTTGEMQILLPSGFILEQEEISKKVINKFLND